MSKLKQYNGSEWVPVVQGSIGFTGSQGIIGYTGSVGPNIAGGLPGSLPYQSAVGETSFVGIGNTGTMLISNGAVPVWTAIPPTILNDISTQFSGATTVFQLKLDQDSINSIVDSKDLEVVINGNRLTPYVNTQTYPWITPYDAYKGFRVISVGTSTTNNYLIIYSAPNVGDSANLFYRPLGTKTQTRKYPYSAITIALGD